MLSVLDYLGYLASCVVLLNQPAPISSVSISVLPVGVMWDTVQDLTIKLSMVGGGFWSFWGVIVLAGGLKDKNGPALQGGIWQTVGGFLVILAAAALAKVAVMK